MRVFGMRLGFGASLTGGRMSALALAGVLCAAAPSVAWAQGMGGIGGMGGMGGGGGGMGSRVPKNPAEKAPDQAPDAVPGAKAREPVAPATHSATDMQPNDALFDAINRGDIAAARDALNRGADMNAVNVLGMTPMELSVDLGRNDISFLLLSMRGDDGGRGSSAPAGAVAGDVPAGKAPAKTAARGKVAASRKGAIAAAKADEAPKPTATPRLFANDGGTPIPSAGFLGFDSRSAAN
ncbi:MAG TPA: ankyrin repeat domain-containing protein [Rhodopila sp.]